VLLPIASVACASSGGSDVHLDPAETQAITHADVIAHAERVSEDAVLGLSCVPAPMAAAPERGSVDEPQKTSAGGPRGPETTRDGDDAQSGDSKAKDTTGPGTGSKAKGAPATRQGDDHPARPDERALGTPRSASEAAERGDGIGPNDAPRPLLPAPPRSAVTPEAVSPTAPAETAPPR